MKRHVDAGRNSRRTDDPAIVRPTRALAVGGHRFQAPQRFVASRPARRPAAARTREPVQTESRSSISACRSRIHPAMSCRSTRARVPKPPGTSRMSTAGSVSKDQRGTMTSPPAAVTGSPVSPTRPVSKKAFPASSQALMKASKGPTASSGSTSSKTWIATIPIDPGASRSGGTIESTSVSAMSESPAIPNKESG